MEIDYSPCDSETEQNVRSTEVHHYHHEKEITWKIHDIL